jgi:formylglycine-generating enzyme required for sulfatase activity
VYVDPFWIGATEVTSRQYADYLNTAYAQGLVSVANGVVTQVGGAGVVLCRTAAAAYDHSDVTWNGSTFGVTAGRDDHPMEVVTWHGACAYANQRSRDEGLTPCYDETTWNCDFAAGGYRLPTEAEWHKAARGGEYNPYFTYPWGNTIDGSQANFWASGDPYEGGSSPLSTPVAYYDGNQIPAGVDMANGYGLYDVAGNVREWCNDRFGASYYGSSPYDNPTGPSTGNDRLLVGGSWSTGDLALSTAMRYHDYPAGSFFGNGFRVVAASR